jgi:hypothetical protein
VGVDVDREVGVSFSDGSDEAEEKGSKRSISQQLSFE